MDIEKEREAFESWIKKEYPEMLELISHSDVKQAYDFSWEVWQAAKAQAVPEWISMEDKYPKAGESVLICINGIRQNIAYFYDCSVSNEYSDHDWFEPVFTGGEAGDECVVKTEDVTHWMLLPKEPAND